MDNNWNQVKVRHNKSSKFSKSNNTNIIQLIPCSSNKYEILHNLEGNNGIVSCVSNRKMNGSICETQTKAMKTGGVEKTIVPKQKIVILGDSHVCRYAELMQDNLISNYCVSSFIKPSGPMSDTVTSL